MPAKHAKRRESLSRPDSSFRVFRVFRGQKSDMLIYHIVLPDVWAAFDTGVWRPASLVGEGFVHCSFAKQVDEVIERYYKHQPRLFVLEIETEKLMSRTLLEPSTGSEVYPHIYGPINRNAIVRVSERKFSRR